MLITFKSKAAADVLMYQEHARPILDLFGKDADKGIFTAAEIPGAVSRLEAEIEARREQSAADTKAQEQSREEDQDRDPAPAAQPVSFATRAYPLLDMLRAAQRGGNSVTWGV